MYKFTASEFDELGNFLPGQELGWMGRRERQLLPTTPPVCDEVQQKSIGFLCTDGPGDV